MKRSAKLLANQRMEQLKLPIFLAYLSLLLFFNLHDGYLLYVIANELKN